MNFTPSYECEVPPVETPALRQFTGNTKLGAIFSSMHVGTWKSYCVRDFQSYSKSNHNLLALVLDGRPVEQRNFLLALYDEMMPDEAAIITMDVLVKRHRLLDIIDKSDAARERVALVYRGVLAGIEYGRLPTDKTGWATGKDNIHDSHCRR